MTHSILSPSGAYRWLACTPSAVAESLEPDRITPYAEEGTLAHSVCEKLAKGEPVTAPEDMMNYCKGYVEYVESIKSSMTSPQQFIEERVQILPSVDTSLYGTCDMILRSEDTIHIIDFKYGIGVPVYAYQNPQLRLYAYGAYLRCAFGSHISTIKMSIYQPRISNVSEAVISVEELTQWIDEYVTPRAKLALKGEGFLSSGDHCRFCRAKAKCRTLMQECAYGVFSIVKNPLCDNLTNDDLSKILTHSQRIRTFLDAVENECLNRMLSGDEIRGYKLVEGRSARKIVAPHELEETLLKNGYEDIYDKKLKPLTALEKVVGKKELAELAGSTIEKPQGSPKVVPEDDPRKSYSTLNYFTL